MASAPSFFQNLNFCKVIHCLQQSGGQWRVVGGAVRDHLLGRIINDVDIVCDLSDDAIVESLTAENIKILQIGRAFGVVQAVFPGQEKYEIACLRRDIETDGRHVKIMPAKNFNEDSVRRDFTINALYMDEEGSISDYHNGIGDIDKRILRFVGTPKTRIEEDYLRILRLFRFQAELSDFKIHPDSLEACYQYGQGLKKISGERICQELRCWLLAPYAEKALKNALPIFAHLPQPLPSIAQNFEQFSRLQKLLSDYPMVTFDEQMRFLLILAMLHAGKYPFDLSDKLQKTLKLRNQDKKFLSYIFICEDYYQADDSWQNLNQQLDSYGVNLVRAHLFYCQVRGMNLSFSRMAEFLKKINTWQVQEFPLTAKKLLTEGVEKGKNLGIILNQTRIWWARGDFVANQQDCVSYAWQCYVALTRNDPSE